MFALGLLIPIAYIPQWTGMLVITGWSVLSVSLPFLLYNRIEMRLPHWLGLGFLAYATLAIAWSPVWQQAIWDLWLLYILAGCWLLGATRDCSKLILGVACGIGISTMLAIPQSFGWGGIFEEGWGPNGTYYIPAGLFVNHDMFGEAAALSTVALIVTRQWWPLILTLPPIYWTECRSALVGLSAAGALWLIDRFRWKALIGLIPLGAGVGVFVFRHGWDGSIALRLAMWQDTLAGLTVFGHGPGSFFMLYPEFAVHTDTMATRPESAHNDFLELVFEFGIGSLLLFALLASSLLSRSADRYLFVAFCAVAFFSFPIRMPVEGLLGMVALGSMCRDRRISWSYFHRWGSTRLARARRAWSRGVPLEPIPAHASGIPSNLEGWADPGRGTCSST